GGRNGAGTRTTLKMIAGRLRPTTGKVQVEGRVSSILELGTGLNPNLTGRQNARVNALFLGLDPWRVEAQLQGILDFAEIGEFADQPLMYYSSGMKARLAFAVLTAIEPEVLILDEALAAGDAQFSAKCQAFVRDLCRSGCTTIVVSHDLAFLTSTCDRVAWIDGGHLRGAGAPQAVIGDYVASFGQVGDFRARPRNLLLRFEAAPEDPDAEHHLHLVGWLDAGGGLTSSVDLADGAALTACLERAPDVGLTAAAARGGWEGTAPGPHGPLRVLRPAAAPGGAAFLVVPVPPAPAPLPHALLVTGQARLPRLRVSALADGTWTALGEFGGYDAWYTPDFPVRHLLGAAEEGAGG
ncbi:MAG: ATP-binding cassette domain-containing protein, partial [Planctomycetes bacterium]|nr:ATP-binding cassette domain-containing protein [Planctomycetota bacterium]